MKTNPVRVTIYLQPKTVSRLARRCLEEKETMTQIIERELNAYLEKAGENLRVEAKND